MIKLKTILREQNYPGKEFNLGARGADVEKIQQRLVDLGFNLGDFGDTDNGVDGKYGVVTRDAVKKFQERTWPDDEEEWDGIVGLKTWDKLFVKDVRTSGNRWTAGTEPETDQNKQIRYTNDAAAKKWKGYRFDPYTNAPKQWWVCDQILDPDMYDKSGKWYQSKEWNAYLSKYKLYKSQIGATDSGYGEKMYAMKTPIGYAEDGEPSYGIVDQNDAGWYMGGKAGTGINNTVIIDNLIWVDATGRWAKPFPDGKARVYTFFKTKTKINGKDYYGWFPSNWLSYS